MIREVELNLVAGSSNAKIKSELKRLKITFKRRGKGPMVKNEKGEVIGREDLDTTNENLAVIRARANATKGQTPHARHLRLDTLRFYVDDNGDIMSYQYARD